MTWSERYDYSAIVDRKPLKLPKGARGLHSRDI